MATRSMTQQQAATIAAQVLDHLKLFAPQSMPRMDDPAQQQALMRLYVDAISRFPLPPKVFPVAALKVAGFDLGGRLIAISDFKQAVWAAHEELLLDDPGYRAECEQIREGRERERNLRMGLTAEGRNPALEAELGQTDSKAIEATKKRFRALQSRATRNPAKTGLQQGLGA